jgi:predicted dehydrogenase
MKKWTLGVLGLGEGRSIISAALQSELYELGNICDLDEILCQTRLEEFGLERYTLNYTDMLEDPCIDVIGIYTPDQLHKKHMVMAMEAGKDVICTKPLMISLDDALELIEVQKRTGKTIFVGQSSRYFEPAIQQRKDYEAGLFGELVQVETQYITDARWFLDKPWSRQKGFSWMYNFLIHAVDLAVWYLPDIETVYGTGYVSENTTDFGLEVPDVLSFVLKDRNGKSAIVKGVYAEPVFDYDLEQSISCTLRGTKGLSRAGYPRLKYQRSFPELDICEVQNYNELHDYYFRFENESHHAGEYQNYIEEFAQLMNNNQKPTPDLYEGLRTLAVMEAMEESLVTGGAVHVADILSRRKLDI